MRFGRSPAAACPAGARERNQPPVWRRRRIAVARAIARQVDLAVAMRTDAADLPVETLLQLVHDVAAISSEARSISGCRVVGELHDAGAVCVHEVDLHRAGAI